MIAVWDGIPVGTVVLANTSNVGKHLPGPWISSLFVTTAYRGRGIATRLIEAAEEKARLIGFGSVYIGVTDLERSLRRRGWVLCEREQHGSSDVAILVHEQREAGIELMYL